jgi:glycosyltransferase involved in cell wall biosynthesis
VGIESFKKLGALSGLFSFASFLKKNGIHIVQTHFRDSSIVGILAAKLAGVPKIVGTRRNQGYWYNRTEVVIQKILNYFVNVFIANSQSTKKWVVAKEGVSEEAVQVIYNGIDFKPFEKLNSEFRCESRKKLDIPINVPVVGIVANLRPVKDIDVFLRASAVVHEQMPAVRFLIVGEGSERCRLEALATSLGLGRAVTFLGRREDIVAVIAAFDVGVLSSDSESFSNTIVEYLAAGIPVACTDVGGCREAVEGEGTGLVVPVKDYNALGHSIVELLSRSAGGNSLPSSGWVRKTCDLPLVLTQTESFYENLSRY